MFLISEFLPGEYVLRTFPLICKGTQSLRFSLSLLAPIQSEDSLFDFEGKIYGIYSKWQDLEALLRRGHSISALVLDSNFFNGSSNSSSSASSSSSPSSHSSAPSFTFSDFFSRFFDNFPKLTSLHLHSLGGPGVEFLSGIWKSALTSLSFTNAGLYILDDVAQQYIRGDYGPPAFSHTLSSLEILEDSTDLLRLFIPYCQNLQHLHIPVYDEIMCSNANLTSLTMSTPYLPYSLRTLEPEPGSLTLCDLTAHGQLKKLCIDNHSFSSQIIHPSLQELSFANPPLADVLRFLTQCPALKLLSVRGYDWLSIGQVIGALNPKNCQHLKLDLSISGYFPSLAEVEEVILRKGIRVNEDFLLRMHDAPQQWRKIMTLAPGLKDMQRLQGSNILDPYLAFPELFSFVFAFQALSLLNISTQVEWDEKLLSYITQTCSTLKVLKVSGSTYQGVLQLHSSSLRTANLSFMSAQFTGFDLDLPNLKHLYLSLQKDEAILLQGILDGGNPLIQLPLLRVLSLNLHGPRRIIEHRPKLHCLTGHGSLVILEIGGERVLEIAEMTFRNLPCLRELTLTRLRLLAHIVFDVPGNCEIYLLQMEKGIKRTCESWKRRRGDESSEWEEFDPYTRKGFSNQQNFFKQITWDENGQWGEAPIF